MENAPFRSVESIKADTVRTIVRKSGVYSWMERNGWEMHEVKKHSKVSANVKRARFSKKSVTSSVQCISPHGLKRVTVSTPHHLNEASDYKKAMLTAFGLHQYDKPLTLEQIQDVQKLFGRFELHSMDIAFDLTHPVSDEELGMFGELTQWYNTTYVNHPLGFHSITKIKTYDKAKQQELLKPLYRLELTVRVSGKLHALELNTDEVEMILIALNLTPTLNWENELLKETK